MGWLENEAKKRLPVPIKRILGKIIYPENVKRGVITTTINGIEARFSIQTRCDLFRIVREFENGFSDSLLETLKDNKNKIFLDVGAAQGRYSVLGAVAGCDVHAVEPDPLSIGALTTNRALNLLEGKLYIHQIALGDKESTADLYFDKKGSSAASLKAPKSARLESVKVKVKSLDDLISAGVMPFPQIIKIDVEGAEALVIKGMLNFLSRPMSEKPKHLFIEIHRSFLLEFGSNEQEVINMIEGCSYQLVESWSEGGEHRHYKAK